MLANMTVERIYEDALHGFSIDPMATLKCFVLRTL